MQEETRSLPSLLGREIRQRSKELCDLCTVRENSTALAVRASIKILALTRRPVRQTWGTAAIASGVHTRSNKAHGHWPTKHQLTAVLLFDVMRATPSVAPGPLGAP